MENEKVESSIEKLFPKKIDHQPSRNEIVELSKNFGEKNSTLQKIDSWNSEKWG